MEAVFQKICMLAGVAGGIVLKAVPGPIGVAVGAALLGVGGLGALFHPVPKASK